MIDILYTILIFSGLMILFKLFDRLKVDNLQAIAVNYFVAGICGIIAMGGKIQVSGGMEFQNPNPQFFIPTAIIIGFLFGQFKFFWQFEKKMLIKMGLSKYFNLK